MIHGWCLVAGRRASQVGRHVGSTGSGTDGVVRTRWVDVSIGLVWYMLGRPRPRDLLFVVSAMADLDD